MNSFISLPIDYKIILYYFSDLPLIHTIIKKKWFYRHFKDVNNSIH